MIEVEISGGLTVLVDDGITEKREIEILGGLVVELANEGQQGPAGASGETGNVSWSDIQDKPLTFSPTAHGSEAHNALDIIDMDVGSGTPNYAEGRIFWDNVNKTLAVMTGPDTTLQIGQETLIRCHNDGETTIQNGTPVRISGNNAAPIIAIAYASDMDADETIGIATQDIIANGYGFVTAFGMVNDINTAGLSGIVYLAPGGGLTSTKPVYPNTVVHLGHVVSANASTGKLFIDAKPEAFQKFFDTFNMGGVYDKAQSTVAYNSTTREFSIVPTGLYWAYFQHGQEFRVDTPLALTHAATTGLHFFYIDDNNTLVTSNTPWDLLTVTPLMVVYYNATTGYGWPMEERHGIRDPQWHQGQHSAIGSYYQSGLAMSDYQLTTPSNSAVQFSIASGIIKDEDLTDQIAGQADAGTYNILHRDGVNGDWQITESTMPFLFGTYAQWNQFTGATWQMTEMPAGDFFNVYVVAVPSILPTKTIVCIPSQQKYATLANAQNATNFNDIAWGSLPFAEFSIIHKIILRTGAGYGSSGRVRIEGVSDLRGTTKSIQVSGGASTTHDGLAGLNAGDYQHLTVAEKSAIIPEAPIDGKQYARKDAGWSEVVSTGGVTQSEAIAYAIALG